MTLYKWSQTASADATADATINWAEGMAPSQVNDSARAMMAAVAKYRDDVSGAIVTAGTSTAYTLSSYQQFDSIADMSGKVIAFTPHVTNGDAPQINVDGLGARYLRGQTGNNLPAGVLIQGTPYTAVYSGANAEWTIHGFFGNPYNLPIGGMIDFIGATAPNSSFVLPFGQAISRTLYASLFAMVGTTYGAGDGSTTFSLPDLRGRVTAGADGMGGALAGRLDATGGMSGTGIGAIGGAQTHTLTLGELPAGITSSNATQPISVASPNNVISGVVTSSNAAGGAFVQLLAGSAGSVTSTGSNSISVTSNNTSGNAHTIVPPTIVVNKLLRVI